MRKTRWPGPRPVSDRVWDALCSDGLEIAAENGERVRVAFALDGS